MEKGGVIVFVIVLIMAFQCRNDLRQMYSGRAVLNAPTASEPRQTAANADLGAIKGNKNAAEKIAAAAPLVIEALKECPKPIPPEQLTSLWENETSFCPGLPIEKCPVSVIKKDGKIVMDPKTGRPVDGAHGPMQHMKSSSNKWGKPGENVEVLADALKMSVRHLCFTKGEKNASLDPASDGAILAYNNDSGYLRNVRAVQAQHATIWASIKSGNGPIIAMNTARTPIPVPPGCERTPRGNVFCPGVTTQVINFFPTVPLTRPATWTSSWGDRRNHDGTIVPHGGFDAGCHTTGEPLVAACDGKIVVAGIGGDGRAGKMVTVECGDHRITCEHMDRIDVTLGQTVAAHQQIGTCGHTGNAEPKPGEAPAPHAHIQLAVRDGNDWRNVNPCVGPNGSTILRCDPLLMGPETRLNKIRDVVASN